MRILGITIPNNKHLDIGLTSLYGIGLSRARSILKEVGIDSKVKADTLTVDQENDIRKVPQYTFDLGTWMVPRIVICG